MILSMIDLPETDGEWTRILTNSRIIYISCLGKRSHNSLGPAWVEIDKKTHTIVCTYWYVNGELHRLDGPALERHSEGAAREWWIAGKAYTKAQFPLAVVMFLLGCDGPSAEIIINAFKKAL